MGIGKVLGRVVYTRWSTGGYGKEFNWFGKRVNKALNLAVAGTNKAIAVSSTKTLEIKLPEMINISNKLSIMKKEVTVGLFKQVMERYEITGHNAEKLKAILNDPSEAGNSLVCLNLFDGREFAKRLSEKTGRRFRIQTENEFLEAKDKLSGNNWTWTETKHEVHNNCFVLRHLDGDRRSISYPCPVGRFGDNAIRLVEDK